MKQALEQKMTKTQPVGIGTRIIRTVFGLAVAGAGVFLVYADKIPAWLAVMLIFFGGFFVSQSLTRAFAETILERVGKIIRG